MLVVQDSGGQHFLEHSSVLTFLTLRWLLTVLRKVRKPRLFNEQETHLAVWLCICALKNLTLISTIWTQEIGSIAKVHPLSDAILRISRTNYLLVLFFHFETHFEVGESFRHEQYRRPRLDPTASSLAVIDNSRSRAILIKRRIQVAHLSASTPLFSFFPLSFPFRRCMKICALVL